MFYDALEWSFTECTFGVGFLHVGYTSSSVFYVGYLKFFGCVLSAASCMQFLIETSFEGLALG